VKALRNTLAVSAVVLSLVVLLVPGSPTASIGRWATDHYSHYSASILFWHRGLAVYTTPMRIECAKPSETSLAFAHQLQLDPDNVCDLPERAGERPLVINWSDMPRPYPPGALLYAAPEAVLYAQTSLSVRTINRITIVKHLLAGHLLVYVLLAMLFGGPDDDDRKRWRSVAFFIGPFVYFTVIPYAMAGFYDSIAIVCVCWAIQRLERDQPLPALGFLSLAAFLHFRAIWYVPLGLVTLAALRRPEHRAELRTRRGVALLAASAVLLALAAFSLVLVGPYLPLFPHNNPVLFSTLGAMTPAQLDIVAIVAVVCGYLAWDRQWLLLALVSWIFVVIGMTVQAQKWHPMFLLPLLAVARWKRVRAPVIVALVLLVIGIARVVYNSTAMPGVFLGELLRGHL
jgi:hypothetical protein